MTRVDRDARIAGLFYMLMVLTGPFVVVYVPGTLFVPGNAAETAANIAAHPSLFRAFIVVGLFAELCFIATVLALYRLLKDKGPELAAVMVMVVLIDAPIAFWGIGNQIATLSFVQNPELLAGFSQAQREVLATLMITIEGQGAAVSEFFWGLWLLPLAVLVVRSGFLPRFLGVWLALNGFAYLATCFTRILLPEHAGIVSTLTLPDGQTRSQVPQPVHVPSVEYGIRPLILAVSPIINQSKMLLNGLIDLFGGYFSLFFIVPCISSSVFWTPISSSRTFSGLTLVAQS